MPFVASFDRFAREEGFKDGKQEGRQEGFKDGKQEGQKEGKREGLLKGIELVLDMKFGSDGMAQMVEVQKITDLQQLDKIIRDIRQVKTLEEFRALLTN